MRGDAVNSRCIMVLDAGTSGARCHIFDADGRIVASASRSWQLVSSDEPYSLVREWHPQRLWKTLSDLMAECICTCDARAQDIAAVAATSQRQAVVFVDGEGDVIYAGPNLDLRALFEGGVIDEHHGAEVYGVTGHLPSFLFAPAKMRWFQQHRLDDYERISCVMTLADWIAFRLTGEIASEPTLAGEAGLLDIKSRVWCKSLLDELNLHFAPIPLNVSGSVIGEVSAESAGDTMLCEGTPVVAAGADTQCGLLGMGVSDPGEVGIVAGWSTAMQMVTSDVLLSADASTWAGCFLTENRGVAESSAGDAGNAYAWLGELLFGGSADCFAEMDALARMIAPGAEGTQTFLGSGKMSMGKPGMRAGGFVFPVPLTLSDMGRGNLVRAALESVAYALKANLEQLEALSGSTAAMIALGGGMTKTQVFVPMLADVLNREVSVSHTPEVSAIGAWLCAATALGEFALLDDAAGWAKERLGIVKPDAYNAAEYSGYYVRWLEACRALEGIGL